MIYAVCALALLGCQAPQTATDTVLATYKLADRDVVAKIPATKLALPACHGFKDGDWTYLFNDQGKLIGRSANGGGWDEAAKLYTDAKAKFDDKTPVWKVKAVLFSRFDVLQLSREGAILQRRSTLENSQITAGLEALARFAAVAEAYGKGRFKVSLDVSIENEPARFGPISQAQPFDKSFCESYFGPRVNGGEYESEDKVYRGPYDSIFFIHPGWKEDGEPRARVNGMPVSGVAFAPKDDMVQGQDLSIELLNRWCGDIALALNRKGLPAPQLTRFGLAPDGNLINSGASALSFVQTASASNRLRVQTDDILTQLALQKDKPSKPWTEVTDDPIGKLAAIQVQAPPSADAMQVVDADGKSYLYARIDFADFVGRHLASSLEPKAIGWFSFEGQTYVVFSLKSNPMASSDLGLLDVKADAELGSAAVKEMPQLPSGNPSAATAPYNYVFKIPDDPSSPESKIAKAVALNENSAAEDRAAVVEMLSAREDAIKLNAAQAFTRVKEASSIKPLTDLLNGFNLRVVEIALKALQFQGGDAAGQAIHKALVNGRYGFVQAVAANLTVLRNDPKDAQYIAVLLASDSWQAWLAGAKAIAQYDDKNAQTFLMTFLWKTDPAVRLAATKGSNTKYDMPVKRLLWSAINDSSDMVRAEACIKLIQSGDAANQAEGYKGVRDDSVWVRTVILDFLLNNPNESHRKAIQVAVADSDPEVRAKALEALKALSGDITLEEIQNTLTDKDPRVQNALVELAIAKKLKLSSDTIAALRSSLDSQVASRAKELAE